MQKKNVIVFQRVGKKYALDTDFALIFTFKVFQRQKF
jgi:hypothetical protein